LTRSNALPSVRERQSRPVGLLLVGAVLVVGLTACSKEPLDISCSDFLGQSSKGQLTTAAMWGHPSRDGSFNAGDELAAGQYVEDLRKYCAAAGHSDDSLKDLEIRFR
jgi:hypothetical protein